MRVLLISLYELGRQPFGLASPAAWLRREGHEVTQVDLSRTPLPDGAAAAAELIAFFLPMHTATRLFARAVERVRGLNPTAHLCAFGLYAPLNEKFLRSAGVATIIGGEFEQPLVDLARRLARPNRQFAGRQETLVSLERQRFLPPDRDGLPPLEAYARLMVDGGPPRVVGYTEASRGCKHRCRHCPVVPVYGGRFRIVQPDVVLEDIRRQVAAGAEHITFGDPDFFNGPRHAIEIVEALHREWPGVTYDVTIKIEHLLDHADLLSVLKATGCLFVTSAVESLEDAVLAKLAKGHTYAEFCEALTLTRAVGLPLASTFIPFTPWTTLESYRSFLGQLLALDLVEQVAPIQLAIRLLIPEGSLLLEAAEIRELVGSFDARALCYPWRNADTSVDALQAAVQRHVHRAEHRGASRRETFRAVWELAGCGAVPERLINGTPRVALAAIPYLTEPWYC
ncbi:MAG: radical SAM protein [Acidobacteriia bacterium]|nr:radical SAM protein [Terriglobia bacterium]